MSLDANSNFDGSFSLPKDAPSGRYLFGFYIGEDRYTEMIYNNGEFYVSDYKKPVFDVSIEMSASGAMLGDTATLTGEATYYFGGNMPNAEYTFSVLSQDYYFNAGKYMQYQFGDTSDYFACLYWGICEYDDMLATSETGSLDEK